MDEELKTKLTKKLQALRWNKDLKSNEYTQRRLTFGKYINKQIKDLPIHYIKWGIMNLDYYWADQFSRELQRRQPKWK